ncbi:MAG: HK97 gp10 family phage protein [Caldilineaceae bacterium]|nr:HK97 gp10 family phage protein [Caldilineaceae bacterium]
MIVRVQIFGVEATVDAMLGAIARANGGSRYVGTDSPYARRIELGFHGYDSLGRFYNQGPQPYLLPAFHGVAPVVPVMIMAAFMAGGTALAGLEEGANAMADLAQFLVPVDTGDLRDSIHVGEA